MGGCRFALTKAGFTITGTPIDAGETPLDLAAGGQALAAVFASGIDCSWPALHATGGTGGR